MFVWLKQARCNQLSNSMHLLWPWFQKNMSQYLCNQLENWSSHFPVCWSQSRDRCLLRQRQWRWTLWWCRRTCTPMAWLHSYRPEQCLPVPRWPQHYLCHLLSQGRWSRLGVVQERQWPQTSKTLVRWWSSHNHLRSHHGDYLDIITTNSNIQTIQKHLSLSLIIYMSQCKSEKSGSWFVLKDYLGKIGSLIYPGAIWDRLLRTHTPHTHHTTPHHTHTPPTHTPTSISGKSGLGKSTNIYSAENRCI